MLAPERMGQQSLRLSDPVESCYLRFRLRTHIETAPGCLSRWAQRQVGYNEPHANKSGLSLKRAYAPLRRGLKRVYARLRRGLKRVYARLRRAWRSGTALSTRQRPRVSLPLNPGYSSCISKRINDPARFPLLGWDHARHVVTTAASFFALQACACR